MDAQSAVHALFYAAHTQDTRQTHAAWQTCSHGWERHSRKPSLFVYYATSIVLLLSERAPARRGRHTCQCHTSGVESCACCVRVFA